ncbi:hypothetical protein [Gordonia neofelifaecis]|uniref:YdhG-like domain-containing protein n=1 Tax=Gordonia neofelifaecis NRRL B-59395 TaxID=644548 RepID=F1YDY3_9ACTN|nr:hypothetical protein [Gordonia neofelifaecis]EGD57073.1 hypothetical protein SCNU_01815 [Gordonia neofelifaecis NRRL B-59395]
MTMSGPGFSDQERAAMQQRAAELKATKGVKGAAKRAREYDACLAAIGELTGTDRTIAERLHVIVSEEAPELNAKTWYGFPSYARGDDVIVFFQPASKFDSRYGTIGFNDGATLDDGEFWATSFAVVDMTAEAEEHFRKLVRKANAPVG